MAFNENVLTRVREKEAKDGIFYSQKSGKLYKTSKWIYFSMLMVSAVINLFYILGFAILFATDKVSNKSGSMYYATTFAAVTAVMLIMLIVSKFNKNAVVAAVFGTVNLVSALWLIVIFSRYYHEYLVYLDWKFYTLHLAPLVIFAAFSSIMAYVVVSSYLKTKKHYNRILEIMFEEYNKLPQENKPEWDDFLNNYKF